MQRVPPAEFEPALKQRLEELWGQPPELYRALGNHPALAAAFYAVVARILDAMRVQLEPDARDDSPKLP